MSFKVLEVQETPNPNARKLVLDRIISHEPLSYRSTIPADANSIAARLLGVRGVTGLLLLHDFVTISKSPEVRWADITPKAKRILAKG